MPLYEYHCINGHRREEIRRAEESEAITVCECGALMTRDFPLPHCPPDGVYSYAPNIGDPAAFERRQQAMRDGVPLYKKEVN